MLSGLTQIPLGDLFKGWTPDMLRDLDQAALIEVQAELHRVNAFLRLAMSTEDAPDAELTALMEQLLEPSPVLAPAAIGFPPRPEMADERGRTFCTTR